MSIDMKNFLPTRWGVTQTTTDNHCIKLKSGASMLTSCRAVTNLPFITKMVVFFSC